MTGSRDTSGGKTGLSRRRFLLAGGVVAAGAGFVALKVLPVRTLFQRRTGDCGPEGPIPPASDARVINGSFSSSFVESEVGFAMVLPPGVGEGEPIHVVFALPGRSGTGQQTIINMRMPDFVAQEISERGVTPFAIASVDGGQSYWHPRASGEDRLSMLLEEFIPMMADRGLGAPGTRRALMGWSMGGYGALLAAETQPEMFAAVAVSSPAIWQSYDEVLRVGGDAFDSAADYAAHDVYAGAGALASTAVRIDVGTNDPFLPNDLAFARALTEPPAGETFTGCHSGDSWRNVVPAQVDFLGAALEGRPLASQPLIGPNPSPMPGG